MSRAVIIGSGSCIPPKPVTNDMLSRIMDVSDQWIRERCGVENRYYVEEGTSTSDLGMAASSEALKMSGLDGNEIDLIIFATMTPDYYFPGCGGLLQSKLGIKNVPSFDIRQQCVGFLYGNATACAVKWFPDQRGLATGLVVFGYGAGTALFNWFIEALIESKGIQATYLYLGIAMLIVLLPLSLLFKYPQRQPTRATGSGNTSQEISPDYKPLEMLKTHQWYLIYFSFAFTISIVLIFGAQMKMVAKEFNIPSDYFKALLFLFPLGNGLSRVIAGSISDKIGREITMVIFYSLLSFSILFFVWLAHIPFLFVAIVFIVALLGGAPFALYPATIGDYYGPFYSTTNYGITYTAKAFAGIISGWFCGWAAMHFGTFKFPLILVAICSLIAAILSTPRIMKPPVKTSPG